MWFVFPHCTASGKARPRCTTASPRWPRRRPIWRIRCSGRGWRTARRWSTPSPAGACTRSSAARTI
ncbi:hypothetical protein ACFQU2_19505 [Siccirubricoccus deserti]